MAYLESENELEVFMANQLSSKDDLRVTRQLRLGPYGKADIVTCSIKNKGGKQILSFTVYELKKGKASYSALSQLCEYMKGIERNLIHNESLILEVVDDFEVLGILVCSDCTNRDDFGWVLAQMDKVYVWEYKISLEEGFTHSNWGGWIRGYTEDENFVEIPIVPVPELNTALIKAITSSH